MELFGHLRDTLTMNFEDLFEKPREMFPRPNVKISASVRAGTMMQILSKYFSLNILSRFSCRSATYDHLTRLCYLSEQDRFTQPESLVPRQGSDYLENQCESRQSCRDFSPQTRGKYLYHCQAPGQVLGLGTSDSGSPSLSPSSPDRAQTIWRNFTERPSLA